MLVLARRPEEKILFPSLGISIQILRVTGQVVRVGVDAPRTVPVIRAEIAPANAPKAEAAPKVEAAPPVAPPLAGAMCHRMRGRLNTAILAMNLAQKQFQLGQPDAAEATMHRALDELAGLERELSVGLDVPAKIVKPRPITTLLVEDNANESTLLECYLRLNGVEVARAGDGYDAMEYLAQHQPPDAILLDMRMPRCDGPATLAQIRANPAYAAVKVFGVSGGAPQEWNITIGRPGVDGWFTKPVDPDRIVETLTQAVQGA